MAKQANAVESVRRRISKPVSGQLLHTVATQIDLLFEKMGFAESFYR